MDGVIFVDCIGEIRFIILVPVSKFNDVTLAFVCKYKRKVSTICQEFLFPYLWLKVAFSSQNSVMKRWLHI